MQKLCRLLRNSFGVQNDFLAAAILDVSRLAIVPLLALPLIFFISCHGVSSNSSLEDPKIAITSPGQAKLPNAVAGRSYQMAYSASGGSGVLTWTNPGGTLGAGACAGLSLSSRGILSGTAAGLPGTCDFMIEVADSTGGTASGNFTLPIQPPLSLTAVQLGDGVQSRAYSQSVAATGGIMPVTLCSTVPPLPGGMTISASGTSCVISGTPQAPLTTTSLTISAVDSSDPATVSGSANTASSLTIQPSLSVEAFVLGNGVVGRPFNQAVAVSGGIMPLTQCKTATPLPDGLTIAVNGATCVISGIPQAPSDSATITISVADSASSATAFGTATGVSPLEINTPLSIAPLPSRIINGMVGFAYSGLTFTATGGTGSGGGVTWTEGGATSTSGLCNPTGPLPPGLSLGGTTGTLSGVPTQASATPGDFQFQVCVEDAPTASTSAAAIVSGPVIVNVLNRYAYTTASAQAIQVIDLASNTFLKSIPLSPYAGPIGLAVTPDGRLVFAVDNSLSQIIVVDTITNAQVAGSPFNLPASCLTPWSVAIPPDPTQNGANRAFVTCTDDGVGVEEVVVLDTANPGGAPLAVIPTGYGSIPTDMAIRKDNSRVYVVLNGTNQMLIIDNTLAAPAATDGSPFNFDPTTDQPLEIGLADNNGKLYAYVGKQNTGNQVSANPFEGIEILDVTTDTPTTVTTLPLAPGAFAFPTDIALDPAGALVFVTLQGAEQLAVVDNTVAVPGFVSGSPFNLPDPSAVASATPYGVIIPPSPSGVPTVYVALFSSSTLSILTDAASPAVTSGSPIVLPVSSFPNEIRYIPVPK